MSLARTFPTNFSSLVADGLSSSRAPLWCLGSRSVSRNEAAQMICRMRHALRASGLRVGDRIVVHDDPSPESLATLIAAMLEQLVVVPVDPILTDARKAQMLDLASPRAIVEKTSTALSKHLICIELTKALAGGATVDPIEDVEGALEAEPCYIFFTSGSTGTPKAVLGRRSGLVHFIAWERDMLNLGEADRVALLTRFSFDVVLRDIFLPLAAGCTCVLPEPGRKMDGGAMVDWLEEQRISLLHTVPSVAHAMLKASDGRSPVSSLRHTLFAGEPLNGGLVSRWRARFPNAAVHNLYGPTETTLAKFHARVPDIALPGIQGCGHPLPGVSVAILAEDGEALQPNCLGEIAICTPYASLGYLDPNAQDGAYLPAVARSGKSCYMTGDLGFLDEHGVLHLRGRKDDQVKIMGVRLELAAVVAAMELHPGIEKAVALAETDDAGQKSLLAWYVPANGAVLTIKELRVFLADHLPPAGIPGRMFVCDSIPLSPNGKVDKQKLPRYETDYETPAHGVEVQIARAFASVLGVGKVGATTDFFSLGGDSFAATALSIELTELLGKSVEPGMFLDAPTPRDLARLLEIQQIGGFAPYGPAPSHRSFDLTPQQRRYLRTFLAGGNRNWCNMVAVFNLPDHVTGSEVAAALHDISVHHDSLRLSFEITSDGTTRQSIRPNSLFSLEEVNLEDMDAGNLDKEIARLKIAEAERPIPVYSDAALFRASLLRLPKGGRRLLWSVHHLVSDGTSQGILGRILLEWLANSRTFRETYANLPSFRDLAHGVNARAEACISSHFPQLLRTPDLYQHSYLPITQEVEDPQRCHAFDATLSDETMAAVRACARRLRCTPYVIFLAGYFRTLSGLSGRTDIAIVTPLAGREHPQVREMIADLINLVPHRIPDLDRVSNAALVRRLRELVTEAARHQSDQFDQVIDALGLPFPEDRNALTGFSLNYMPQKTHAATAGRVHSDRGYKLKYDVLFLMRDFRNCLNVEVQYRSGLFDEAGIENLFDEYETNLKEICSDTRSE